MIVFTNMRPRDCFSCIWKYSYHIIIIVKTNLARDYNYCGKHESSDRILVSELICEVCQYNFILPILKCSERLKSNVFTPEDAMKI